MKSLISKHIILALIFLLLSSCFCYSQITPQGFNYQTTIKDGLGADIINQSVSIRFSIYSNSPAGTLVWQEDHSATTDIYGHINKVIGTGLSTGAGFLSSFSQISWASAFYYLKVSIDATGGSSYTDMGTSQLFSVPYSLYSSKTGSVNSLSFPKLHDVNLSGLATGKLLKWSGAYWMPAIDNDSDTVLYVVNSAHVINSDTAYYVYGTLTVDTLLFAYQSDSAAFSSSSLNALNTNSSNYSDTALYAFASSPTAWMPSGNAISGSMDYFGTNDNSNVNFISNNVIRATLKNTGNLSINNSAAGASLAVLGNDGLIVTGSMDSTLNTVSGAGTRMLIFPARGAFRAGYIDSNQWDTANIGNYSIAAGYNNKARNWSFSSGFNNQALDCSVTFGSNSQALGLGVYPEGGCITMGDNNISTFRRTVTLGKNNIASNSAATAIGFSNTASGNTSICIGSYCVSSATRATAIGYHASAQNTGSFVFADYSSSATVTSTASHQLTVRASGGVIFYTDSLNTMGVSLSPGSGSWASVSDVHKKENFLDVNYESVLEGIDNLKIRSWNYKSQSRTIRHIGPMAQDFYKEFKVGENNITISSVDMDGVILSGIKGLNNRLGKLQSLNDVDALQQQTKDIDNTASLNKRLDAIEAAINKK